jgi:hypothetical protein
VGGGHVLLQGEVRKTVAAVVGRHEQAGAGGDVLHQFGGPRCAVACIHLDAGQAAQVRLELD